MEPSFPNASPPAPRESPPAETSESDAAVTQVLGPPSPESRRFQHYEICLRGDGVTLHELGRGTMGISYKARDVNLDAPVALKVINARYSAQPEARARFQREARAAAQLRHPNVASVFHFGETPAGRCFYAMELIEGETLEARVRRAGPLPAALVVEIGLGITAALGAAARRGLVHRDLKPANVMLAAPDGQPPRAGSASSGQAALVKVIDFGLAKAVTAAADPTDPEQTRGAFVGSPLYASPEQFAGATVDARADIYSLGATLWFLLTGRAPFAGRSPDEIQARQLHRPLPLTQLADARVPAPLATLLAALLAPDPQDRPASPDALREALERCREELRRGRSTQSRVRKEKSRPRVGWRRGRGALAAGVAALAALLLLAGAAVYLFLPRVGSRPVPVAGAVSDKSIAVLPLENLSEEKENAYFADGIQDDLLSSLAKIKELRVISRSSVMSYRNPAARNLREIGRQLGVAHLLEGSVRRVSNRVLVNVALTDTRTARQVWAEHFDRTLADSLTLQGELATEIAAALRATLSPEEKARVSARPTGNADAYVLYLRAREHHTRPTLLLQDMQAAANLYTQALALDPGFALAHARLSAALAYIYLNYQPTAEIKARARAEAEEALRLRPDSGEGSLARALCLYWTEKDYQAALRELAVAARLLPGAAEIDLFTGAIRRRQGRWPEARADLRQALAHDPRSVMIAREIMVTDCSLRDWPAAARDGALAVALAPELPLLWVEKNWVAVWSAGDLAPLRADLAAVPAGVDPDGGITIARWDTALLARDFAEAERVLQTAAGAPDSVVSVFGPVLPRSYLLGCVALARGEPTRAQPLFEAARPAMETEARDYPSDAFRQAQLGLLYAYLGRKEEALRCGRRAVEILPESKDALYGACVSGLLALIHTRAGESDQALALIERLLKIPGPVFAASEGSITQRELRLRWQWDPLRGDPRFQALLTGPEPKTVY